MRAPVLFPTLALSFWLFSGCGDNAPLSAPAAGGEVSPTAVLDLASLRKGNELLAAVDIAIPYDLTARAPREYRAIALEKVLRKYFGPLLEPAAADSLVLILVCKDGYAPFLPLKQALGARGYLAFKAQDSPMGKDWPDSLAESYAPFYLVWDVPAETAPDYPWPYGLSEIRLAPPATAYADAYPKGNGAVMAGFGIYRDKCIRCHSINKVGGSMGQEFNYPKNLAEYWKKADVKAFVDNPQSFRYNSTMTEHPALSDEQFELLWAYLLYMKEHKLKE